MIKSRRLAAVIAVDAVVAVIGWIYFRGRDIALLSPAGTIAEHQRNLMLTATILMLIIVVPVFLMTFLIVWRYRDGNKGAKYTPEVAGNRLLEGVWWAIPTIIISVLGVIIWQSSHQLDPFKSLASTKAPLKVQVVALQWKWLFIYPDQGIASINRLQLPLNQPVDFAITADAPMNSFWIPKLGGQIYAMAGMTTHLHLQATELGDYPGSSANLSGEGFSNMRFMTRVTTAADFAAWVDQVKKSPGKLTMAEYNVLAEPTLVEDVTYYSSTEKDLHAKVVEKYMHPVAKNGGEDADNHASHGH